VLTENRANARDAFLAGIEVRRFLGSHGDVNLSAACFSLLLPQGFQFIVHPGLPDGAALHLSPPLHKLANAVEMMVEECAYATVQWEQDYQRRAATHVLYLRGASCRAPNNRNTFVGFATSLLN
jgi:hypothetical protein